MKTAGNSSAPVAPLLLCELLVTADQEEAPKQPSVHFVLRSNHDHFGSATPCWNQTIQGNMLALTL
jgi:hypothetical protein